MIFAQPQKWTRHFLSQHISNFVETQVFKVGDCIKLKIDRRYALNLNENAWQYYEIPRDDPWLIITWRDSDEAFKVMHMSGVYSWGTQEWLNRDFELM